MRNREGFWPSPPNTTIPKFCKKNEAPIADIRIVILGDSLNGLYANLSRRSPINPVNTEANINTSHQGIDVNIIP